MNRNPFSPEKLPERAESFTAYLDEHPGTTVHDQFHRTALRHPERPALVWEAETWSYQRLARESDRIAFRLLKLGVSVGEPVAVLPGNSPFAVACFLGVLRAGGIWMPLDPQGTTGRLRETLGSAGCRFAVFDAAHRALAVELHNDQRRALIVPDELQEANEAQWPAVPPETNLSLMYSSGSTGAPKGILQTHRSRIRQIAAYIDLLRIGAEDRVSLLHRLHFAASSSDLLSSLLTGAALCHYNVEGRGFGGLGNWLRDERISILHWLPTAFRLFVRGLAPGEEELDARAVVLGSEAVLDTDFRAFCEHFSVDSLFVNRMGSTETGNFAYNVLRRGDPVPPGPVAAGYPPPGWLVEVVDESGQRLPAGSQGEIVVRSRYFSPGFWRQPELTSTTFVPAAAGETPGMRTGDLGVQAEDGCLSYLGRKSASYRVAGRWINLAEIERALDALPGVREAAAAVVTDGQREPQVVGYLAYVPDRAPLSPGMLHQLLGPELPSFLIPTRFVAVNELPRSSTGKIDRRALPQPGTERPELDVEYAPPASPLEEELVRIWSEVLAVSPIGRFDSFFDLGGNSLRGQQVLMRIQDRWGVTVTNAELFSAPTSAELATLLIGRIADEEAMAALLDEMEAGSEER